MRGWMRLSPPWTRLLAHRDGVAWGLLESREWVALDLARGRVLARGATEAPVVAALPVDGGLAVAYGTDQVGVIDARGPSRWTAPGELLAARGAHVLAVSDLGRRVDLYVAGTGDRRCSVALPVDRRIPGRPVAALVGDGFEVLSIGVHRYTLDGERTGVREAGDDAFLVTSDDGDVCVVSPEGGNDPRTVLEGAGFSATVPFAATRFVIGGSVGMMTCVDGTLRVVSPDGAVLAELPGVGSARLAADDRTLLAVWPGAAAWYAGQLFGVELPAALGDPESLVWDGLPVAVQGDRLVPIGPRPIPAWDPEEGSALHLAPLEPDRMPDRPETVLRAVLSRVGMTVSDALVAWVADRQALAAHGLEPAVTGWTPEGCRDPHLLALVRDATTVWCLCLMPGRPRVPLVVWDGQRGLFTGTPADFLPGSAGRDLARIGEASGIGVDYREYAFRLPEPGTLEAREWGLVERFEAGEPCGAELREVYTALGWLWHRDQLDRIEERTA